MIKKLCALVLAVVMVLMCFTGCHKKGETVVSIDGYDIPSGLYLAVQFNAFNAFTAEVSELNGGSSISDIKEYFKYSIDGKSAKDWINDTTLDDLKKYVAIERLFEENSLEFTDDDQSMADYYASYYWTYYGYQQYYEENGVSEESFKLTWANNVKSNKLFTFFYDKADETTGLGGLYAVSDEDLIAYMGNNYILANRLSADTSDMTDDEITALMDKLNGYATRINKGESFDAIQLEYQTETGESSTSTSTNTSTDSIYPASATLYDATSSATDYAALAQVKATAGFNYGTAYATNNSTTASACTLDVIYDVTKDSYTIEQNRTAVLSSMKTEEYQNLLTTKGNEYEVVKNSANINYYNPQNIKITQK